MTWSDALLGYERQLIGWTFIVEMASERLCAGSNNAVEIELAGLTKSEAHQTGDLLRALAASDTTTHTESSKQKWLFILLAWVFNNKAQFADPLDEVESIYADFDYPVEVEPFVRYMPPKDGYDATQHSAEQNRERLFALWKEFLDDAQRKFAYSEVK